MLNYQRVLSGHSYGIHTGCVWSYLQMRETEMYGQVYRRMMIRQILGVPHSETHHDTPMLLITYNYSVYIN